MFPSKRGTHPHTRVLTWNLQREMEKERSLTELNSRERGRERGERVGKDRVEKGVKNSKKMGKRREKIRKKKTDKRKRGPA